MIKLARCRAPYICQSQSLNIYFAEPNHAKMSASHIYAWKLGLKTGQYYMRSRPARDAIQFTLDIDAVGVKDEGLYIKKNLSKKEMDDLKKKKAVKRTKKAEDPVEGVEGQSLDLNKRRKLSQN